MIKNENDRYQTRKFGNIKIPKFYSGHKFARLQLVIRIDSKLHQKVPDKFSKYYSNNHS